MRTSIPGNGILIPTSRGGDGAKVIGLLFNGPSREQVINPEGLLIGKHPFFLPSTFTRVHTLEGEKKLTKYGIWICEYVRTNIFVDIHNYIVSQLPHHNSIVK